VIRNALGYALARPSIYNELCAHPMPTLDVDLRTPEQIRAWHEYSQELESFDMGTIVRECGLA
jgi:hypothetical protein